MAMAETEPRTDRRHQDALYAAQDWAGLHRIARHNYRDIRDVEVRLTEIMESEWWIDRYPDIPRPGLARLRKGSRWNGIAGRDGLWLQTLDDAVLLHELAHWICDQTDHGIGHGPEYVEVFLPLVREFMGFMAYAALKNGLVECRYWAI